MLMLDERIARICGCNAAILFQHFCYCISWAKANKKNFYDGEYWTYDSMKSLVEKFDFMSRRKVELALAKLVEEGLVKIGHYSTYKLNRTNWYALTDYGKEMCQQQITSKCENRLSQNVKTDYLKMGKPRTILSTTIKSLTNNISSPSNEEEDIVGQARPQIPFEEIVSYLNEKTGKSYKHTTPKTKTLIQARWNEGFREDDFYKVIDNKSSAWKDDSRMKEYLRPETLFGTKFESYLQANDTWRF